jgi:hypothetical protein
LRNVSAAFWSGWQSASTSSICLSQAGRRSRVFKIIMVYTCAKVIELHGRLTVSGHYPEINNSYLGVPINESGVYIKNSPQNNTLCLKLCHNFDR